MAFDHRKKSNYHYIDISNIDESLLNNPLYPNRPTATKYNLYFADKAFLYEAVLSRYNAFKGITINGENYAVRSENDNFAITSAALSLPNLKINDWLVTRLPSDKVYSSWSAAEAAECGVYAFSEDYKGTNYSSRDFRFIKTGVNAPLYASDISLAYDLVSKSSPYKYSYYYYSPISLLSKTYSDIIIEGSPSFSRDIAYHKASLNWGDYNTVNEGYRIITSDFYSLSFDESIKNCVKIHIFVLVNFSNQIDNNNNYRFIELATPDGTTNSYKILDIGKTIISPTISDYASSYSVYVEVKGLYVFAESTVDISV